MLSAIAKRAARTSSQQLRCRALHFRTRSDNTRAPLLWSKAAQGRGAWRALAVAAALTVVAASDNPTPAQSQSTKRYSRNIRGSYDLLEKTVGTGGFGHVVAGVHRETGEHVAVKFLSKKACSRNRVASEADILHTAGEHVNIVSFYGFYEDDDNYYLVMEMARGGELFDQLVQYGAYSESQARTIVKAIVDALTYLHQQRIVHLDLKPENIMLSVPVNRAAGKDTDVEPKIDIGSLIRLVDFGSASRLDSRRGVVKYGSGTVAYSPPELLSGKPADDKADIWALGMIMFIMLRGFHPFDPFNDANDDVLEKRIINNEYPLHAFTWDGLSKPAKQLITRMLDPNPANRPTAIQLLRDEWFCSDALSQELLEDTAENLRIFHRGRRRLKAILLAIMADLLPADVHRRTKTLGSRRAAIRWIDYDNKEYVTAQDLTRAYRMLGEGTTEREKRELTTSVRRRQTTNIHPDAQEMMQAANGLPHKQRKVIRYQDLMHLLPPLCPGRIVQQDDFVYNVGDQDGFFYLLKEGSVSLMVPAGNGRERKEGEPVPLLGAVDVSKNSHFGQLELLETVRDDRSRSHAAKCRSHSCEVYEISSAEFSLLTDVFAPVAHRLVTKAETTAQALTLVHLKSTKEHKMVVLDHPMTAHDLAQQTFPDEPVIVYVVDGSLTLHDAEGKQPTELIAGRFIALHDEDERPQLDADCPSMVHPKAQAKLVPSKNPNVDTMLLAVPLRHARDILESPAMHAIRHNLPA